MAPRRSGKGRSSKHRDEYIPASAQGRGDEHPSSIAMYSIDNEILIYKVSYLAIIAL